MKYLLPDCSRGGIGRRKGLKILVVIARYEPKAQFSLKYACRLSAIVSVINLFNHTQNRHMGIYV